MASIDIDILTIAENERRFVAQELHDHLAQILLQMNMQVSIVKKLTELDMLDEAVEELTSLESQTMTASERLRGLIADLRPPTYTENPCKSLLQQQIEIHQMRGGPPVKLTAPDDFELSGARRLALIRIVQEILLNVRKHAQASQVNITIEATNDQLTLTAIDDGVGFDDALVPNPLADKGGAGFINMDIRASAINGVLNVKSQPGEGSTIEVIVPL